AGLGSNNIDANARFCMASAVAGFMTSFGADAPMGCFDDIEHADNFFIWGANMAEMHPVLFSRISRRKAAVSDVKVVELATQRTRTSKLADLAVLFKPQSDLAILNAMASVIIEEGLVNEPFINRHTVFKRGLEDIGYGLEDGFEFEDSPGEITFDQYRRFVSAYSPEEAEHLSGVPAATIVEMARLFAGPGRRTMSFWTMGSNQHSRGTWVNNLIYNLHLLTGKIAEPGNSPFSLTGQPSACGSAREVGIFSNRLPADMLVTEPEHRAQAEEIWGVPAGRINPEPGYHAVEMFRAFDREEIKCMWVMCNNVLQSHPNLGRYRNGAKKEGNFLVVSDAYPTRTTELADVVLPAAMWIEKEGAYGNSERRTQFWKKIVEPPAGCRSDLEQIVDFARRLGHGYLFEYDEPHLEKALWEEYRRFGRGRAQDLAPFDTYHEARGLRWPVVDGRETRWRYNGEHDPFVAADESRKSKSFYGNRENGGRAVIWARPYEPAAEAPDKEYPFWLCTGRVLEHWHSGTMTGRVMADPGPARTMREALVNINPEDATGLGIEDGDQIRVESRRGQAVFKASVNGRSVPQRGMVFIAWFDRDRLVNILTLDAYCPISKQPDFKKCAVRLTKLSSGKRQPEPCAALDDNAIKIP
ncbi:MAG: molybdopterin-dependent oxidoreductase, partial [Actinomycetota bacterium]